MTMCLSIDRHILLWQACGMVWLEWSRVVATTRPFLLKKLHSTVSQNLRDSCNLHFRALLLKKQGLQKNIIGV
jgi:hypothetical protein